MIGWTFSCEESRAPCFCDANHLCLWMTTSFVVIDTLRQTLPHDRGPKKDDIVMHAKSQYAVKTLAKESHFSFGCGFLLTALTSTRLKELAERLWGESFFLID